ncbi:RDD family protein [Allosalinactinospora lopnorensis]|uniref:RDD family protein n=1 Tax=Allosalinactinospora lopnorensis TaxID=1352348 RepID=UPI0006989F65|nr:RDD family protein [Allosalinactinospora lopnorensis]
MNYPPPPRNEGMGAPFEQGGSWPRGRTGGPESPDTAYDPQSETREPYSGAAWDEPSGRGTADPGTDGRYPLAGWVRRAVARLVDWTVVAVPTGVAAALIGFVWIGAQAVIAGYGESAISRNFGLIFSVCCFVVLVGYDTVSVKKQRRTIGKRLMGLEVAPLSSAGHRGPIPVASMVARAALLNLVFLFMWSPRVFALAWLLFVVFIALWPLWSGPNRQGMHDRLAGTLVVRVG